MRSAAAPRPSAPGDDELVARTAAGEEAAFRLLVDRWERDVLAFLTHMTGSRDDAEDLAQETFVRVFRQAGSYRAEGRFRSWLLRIAGNLARSRHRRRRLLKWLPLDLERHDVASATPSADRRLEAEQTADVVRAAIARLPVRQRQALVLHRFQGLRYVEVAEAMGTSLAGVESLIQRALAGLRADLIRRGETP
ncbi:MAG: sigma-70 family RNA polymerase sigma factor [bacterium]|nr:sigma-70 family RNA polymerase sigma factor [bacterium]